VVAVRLVVMFLCDNLLGPLFAGTSVMLQRSWD